MTPSEDKCTKRNMENIHSYVSLIILWKFNIFALLCTIQDDEYVTVTTVQGMLGLMWK